MRPEVDDSLPKVNRLPLYTDNPFTSVADARPDAAFAMNTDLKSVVDVALGDQRGVRGLQPRLHAGQTAIEHEVEVAGLEQADRRGVVGDGHVLDLHVELRAEVRGHGAVACRELLRVLIGNRADLERAVAGRAARRGRC